MKLKLIAIVGRQNGYEDLLEKTLRAADTKVYSFAGQTGLFRSARGRRFDLALVRVADAGVRALSTISKVRARNAARTVVAILPEELSSGGGEGAAPAADAVLREPYGYAELIETVAAFIAPNELLEEAHRGEVRSQESGV